MFRKEGNRVLKILEKNTNGLTITEIVNVSKLSRHTIIAILARLEGANKVSFRKVGMAKIYLLKKDDKNGNL